MLKALAADCSTACSVPAVVVTQDAIPVQIPRAVHRHHADAIVSLRVALLLHAVVMLLLPVTPVGVTQSQLVVPLHHAVVTLSLPVELLLLVAVTLSQPVVLLLPADARAAAVVTDCWPNSSRRRAA